MRSACPLTPVCVGILRPKRQKASQQPLRSFEGMDYCHKGLEESATGIVEKESPAHLEQQCYDLVPHIWEALRWSRGDAAVREYRTVGEMLDDFPRPLISKEEEEELTSPEAIQEILDRFQELADREAAEREANNR
ncbi:Protein CBG04532 [Caenorhabditis briggsae]|uniref:Protein CBG04532 n=1 Tax=Caenorhabditis briggsae TaxID=6238 RepID=A8WXN5_CAEBR|nr:Protein CBG04532 [Caenorhabditis briggsae]CAP25168.2 Protein CBG04532 [Caenorhabditis briggsae]